MAKRNTRLVAFGARLADLRKERNLTQEQLAERANLGSQYISDMERGVANPTLAVLNDVAGALGLTVARLTAKADEVDLEIAAMLTGSSKAERTRVMALVKLLLAPTGEN